MISLYIHWPFCLSKCPYCDFNSHVRRSIDEDAWKNALLGELKRLSTILGKRTLKSIFFGGGTPSLMSPQTVAALIDEATTLWQPEAHLEISLEANPNSVEVEKFLALKKAGVNRLSLGVQALNDTDLKALGRQHSANEAIKAIEIARSTFDRVSFDLIYARTSQTISAWKTELTQALKFGTDHLSLYQLTIEPGTAFATLFARGELPLPHDDLSADLFELTQSMMIDHGMPAYEISNHAKPGSECRHNLVYWRYQDYAGVGPGAHGRLTIDGKKYATRQKKSPEAWLQSIKDHGTGDDEVVELTATEQMREILMMGLRTDEPIDCQALPIPLTDFVQRPPLEKLTTAGYLTFDGRFLSSTTDGRQRLNAVLECLYPDLIPFS
ncbi:MAG: radical SAM family heme chaperone HemW [Alphaproteobacteria bacterium]|nr:radical SAM family heme chaperone HemW [Alphaproteobacteria bacterium]